MNYPVVKGAAYALVQANSMLLYQGSTQITERLKNEQSEHLKALPEHLRSFEDAVSYPPNQAYIGNITPDQLKEIPHPWYENPLPVPPGRKAREIMPKMSFRVNEDGGQL